MASTIEIETIAAQRSVAGIDSFAVHSRARPRVALQMPRLRIKGRRKLGLGAGAMAVLVLIVAIAVECLSPGADARSVQPDPAPAVQVVPPAPKAPPARPAPSPWIEVNRPIPLFDLAGSAFSKLPLTYRARRRQDASERRDLLVYGSAEADKPFLSLSILRSGPHPETSRLFVDMARLAADRDLAVTRSGVPTDLPTRFGPFEAVDLILAGGKVSHACLGFRLRGAAAAPSPVTISGFACGTREKPMDRKALACVIDRVDLLSAGDDAVLRNFFVEAERRRGEDCGGSHMLAPDTHVTWLDGAADKSPSESQKGDSAAAR